MKFLFASDSFKGTLSSADTGRLLGRAALHVFPDCSYEVVAVADGGEGTTDAVLSAVSGERITLFVSGPLGERIQAFYGKLDDTRAVMEMAAASGLPMVPDHMRDPRRTSTYGTGEMIKDALDRGFRDISIAVGGSATNDGGMGAMRALGIRFLDADGNELSGCGADLIKVQTIDVSGLDPRVSEASFTVMCDVTNPLCGKDGATRTFGKQKGGTPEILDELEHGMEHYRDIIKASLGTDLDAVPGAGAAGGLGGALLAFLHAKLKSGIETVLDLIDFDARLKDVSLVVTGEGRTDWQSAFGKVMQGVGERCRRQGIPAVAVVGSLGEGAEKMFDCGISSMITTVNAPMRLQDALEQAETLYADAAERLFRMLRAGQQMR